MESKIENNVTCIHEKFDDFDYLKGTATNGC